ncbi:MAG: hypothetical protein IJ137_02060 [Eubacterium sp.]|nr:hypothetical protein [Eubacterium sp.]
MEAALIVPVFLCAAAALLMIGQMLLVEGEVQHAAIKTAAVCAKQETALGMLGKGSSLPGSYVEAGAVFHSTLQGKALCESCILGGSHGIVVSMDKSDQEKVRVRARYTLRIPVPFFSRLVTVRQLTAEKRMYTGYQLHKGEGDQEDKVVYLAENGSVYHTSLSCTHISLRISGSALTRALLEARGLSACEKCMRSGSIPEAFYVTAEGDCYHSSISCSGLKRTVRSVRLSQVRGMRICSRCAARSGR